MDFSGDSAQYADIQRLLFEGIAECAKKARDEDLLDPPYRKPYEIPFDMSNDGEGEEDELFSEGGANTDGELQDIADEEDDVDKVEEEPAFEFDYGFNGLRFLAQYLRRNNPKNLARRAQALAEAQDYLAKRGEKAKERDANAQKLLMLVNDMKIGISHGPIIGDVTDSGFTVWARGHCSGAIVIQLSLHKDFSTVLDTAVVEISRDRDYCGKHTFEYLQAATSYYGRVCLMAPARGFPGPDAELFFSFKARTWPDVHDTSGEAHTRLRLLLVSDGLPLTVEGKKEDVHVAQAVENALKENRYDATLWLGDYLPAADHPEVMEIAETEGETGQLSYRGKLYAAYRRAMTHPHLQTLSENAPIMLGAWNDGCVTARQKLVKELEALEANAGRSKRGGKKEPKILKPASIGIFEHYSPYRMPHWRTPVAKTSLGHNATLISVPTRGHALSADTLDALSEALSSVSTTWKIVALGCPLSFRPVHGVASLDKHDAKEEAVHRTQMKMLRENTVLPATNEDGESETFEHASRKSSSSSKRSTTGAREQRTFRKMNSKEFHSHESHANLRGPRDVIKRLQDLTTGPRPKVRNVVVLSGNALVSHLTYFSDRQDSFEYHYEGQRGGDGDESLETEVRSVHSGGELSDLPPYVASGHHGWYELGVGSLAHTGEHVEKVNMRVEVPGSDPVTHMILGPLKDGKADIEVYPDEETNANYVALEVADNGELNLKLHAGPTGNDIANIVLQPDH